MADLMTGSAAGLREGVALLTRMHFSHSALPDTAFNVLPSSAQRCAAPLLANPPHCRSCVANVMLFSFAKQCTALHHQSCD